MMMPRPLSAEARQKAIHAASELVGEGGIEGFTVDEVARRSGVAKSTLYRHWNTGNELLMAALDCHVEPIPTPDTGSLAGDLLSVADTMRQVVATEGTRQLMLDMMAAAARDPELAQIKQAMMLERSQPLAIILDRAMRTGQIPSTDLDEAVLFVNGSLIGQTLVRNEPPTDEEIALVITRICQALGALPAVG